jgi:hypothetical protein
MTSFERLVASDPGREAPYEARDFDAMLSRVVTASYPHMTSWRAFKARVLAALGASGAVMAVAISTLAGAGPALDRLTFAAAPVAPAASTTKMLTVTSTGVQAPIATVSAERLSTSVPVLPTYSVSTPSDGAATLSLVGRALGVRLSAPSVVHTTNGVQMWLAHGPWHSLATLVRMGGVDYWRLAPPSSSLMALGGSYGPSRASLERRALDIVAQVGAFETAPPLYSVGPGSRVVVPLVIAGYATNLADTFTFDANSHVIEASGVYFSLGPPANYPLLSARAAALHAPAQASLFAHAISTQGWVGYVPFSSAYGVGSGDVHLASSSLQYRVVVDAHNVAHAMPMYLLEGTNVTSSQRVVLEASALETRYLAVEVHGGAG